MWTNICVVPLCFQGNPLYHADIDLEVDPPDNIYVTTPMLPENSAAEPEAQEQTEASVIPTVGIVIESGEQVSSTLSSTYYTKTIYILVSGSFTLHDADTQWISLYSSAHPWRVHIASEQVDLQLNCPDGQTEILEKYQKYCKMFLHTINFEDLLWFKSKLGKIIFIRAS